MNKLTKALLILAIAAAGTFALVTNKNSGDTSAQATIAAVETVETAPQATEQTSGVIEANSAEELDSMIRNSTLPVAIMVQADWCDYCQAMKPMYAEAAKQLEGKVLFLSVNVDKVPIQVQGLPTTFLISAEKTILGAVPGAAPDAGAIVNLLTNAFNLQ